MSINIIETIKERSEDLRIEIEKETKLLDKLMFMDYSKAVEAKKKLISVLKVRKDEGLVILNMFNYRTFKQLKDK